MSLNASRIRQLASRGRSVADISARHGVSKVDVCRILTMQAEAAAQLKRERLAASPPPPAPRGPLPLPAHKKADANAYLPSRKEIRQACRQIRKTWSARERVVRYYLSRVDGVNLNYSQARELQAVRVHMDVKLLELADMVA